ncbi:hypothetical protein OUZ56_030041 [Daphnia magna]|uniref:Uncharacterized protein n=1 Tax=Daphnia magna TaxID=35525 RepID=A0ABQ9ZQ51_9CRUS|nr:hypothetical protein OUZ56_030041 [Daphnia magna]
MSGGAGRARGRPRPRDEFWRFAPRVDQAIVGSIVKTINPSNLVPRNGSRVDDCVGEPGELSGWEDCTRAITRESNLGQHQASISEEETLAWADGENSSDSEDSEEGLEWDFEAFRRRYWLRSSVASARLLRGRRVNAHVAEATKLAYLWQGLRPIVTEQLWSFKPTNCDEFLQDVKRFQEMTDRGKEEKERPESSRRQRRRSRGGDLTKLETQLVETSDTHGNSSMAERLTY